MECKSILLVQNPFIGYDSHIVIRFQWCFLQIKQLLELQTKSAIRDRLGKLPHGLKAAYDEIYGKILSRNKHERVLANRAFMWVMFACEPLKAPTS